MQLGTCNLKQKQRTCKSNEPKHRYCKQEPDETLIIIKTEWTQQLKR